MKRRKPPFDSTDADLENRAENRRVPELQEQFDRVLAAEIETLVASAAAKAHGKPAAFQMWELHRYDGKTVPELSHIFELTSAQVKYQIRIMDIAIKEALKRSGFTSAKGAN